MNDGNCRIIAPISNTTLFESNLTTPGAVACSYPTTGWTPGGNWSYTLLANTGDCARIVNLAGCEVFSVCYGNVNLNTQIYFANGAELVTDHRNTVYFFNGNDPLQQVNWSIGCSDNETVLDANQCGANFQTPGVPNNAANAAFIGQFNNNCQPILPMIASNTSTNVVCNNGSNGSALISASGGIAPYQISWTGTTSGNPPGNEISVSGGTYNLTGLVAGTYNITVTGTHGCTATTTVTITSPTVLSASNTTTNTSCNGNNGSGVITAIGGTAPYNVSWTGTTSGNPAGNEIAASGGTYTVTNLTAGTYNVTVTDANGCTATTTVMISAPTTLNVSNIATNVSCNGGANGSGIITATGGTAPYNVSWTGTTSGNPAGNEIAASGGTYTVTGLTVGTYNITVTDANGCTAATAVTVNQPTDLLLSLGAISPQSCICNGSASVSVTGAIGPYNYNWYNAVNNSNINQPTPIASNLCSGPYYCVVTTTNGCSDTISVFVPTTCSSYGTFATATMVENCDTLQFYNSTWGTLPDQINPLGILLNGFNYGSFFQNSGTLILRGGEVKTYKDAGANVCGAKLHYAVYPAANPPANPSFNILDLPFKESCNLGSSSFPTGGPCFFPGDQKWAKENYTIDLTTNAPGAYILDVFYAVPGSFTSTNGCSDTIYVNNNGLNYKALFTIEPLPSITPNGPTSFCQGGTVTLTSNYTNDNQWNTGSDLNSIDVNNSGAYSTEIDLGNNCPLASDSLIVNVLQLPELISLEGGGEFCEGEAINLIVATFSGSPNWTLTYNFNAGANQTINSSSASVTLGNAEGVYILSGLTDNNCSNTLNDTVAILINPIPEAPIISGGGTYCFGTENPSLSVAGSTGNFTWYSDENLTQIYGTGATIIPTQDIGSTNYWITETVSGCEGTPNLVTLTYLDCQITIPTAFTPNGDLTNDFWNIQDIDAYYPENQVFIYNRWGALLYQSDKGNYLTQPWDGKFKDENLPVGTYYYIIETGSETLKGIVSIILE
jgi:gliding motility-associated-like protein